jgi:DNA mismatch repair protein MutS2
LYKLALGQAGSSFTFEVALKNGIPFSLINRAKKKIEVEKYALTKPLPPYKRNDQRWKNFADAEGRRNQSARRRKEDGNEISRLSKTRKLSRAI